MTSADRRFLHPSPDDVIRMMHLARGTSVLDVGAGLGFYTFPFARAVGTGGRVFASDIDDDMIARMRRRAQRHDITNVVPFLVHGTDFDEAYLDHAYDTVFLSSVFRYIRDPIDYFRRLRPCLRDNAQICIIEARSDPGFSRIEFSDQPKVVEKLAEEGRAFPVFQRLPDDLVARLSSTKDPTLDETTIDALVVSFDRMLEDVTLYPDLRDYFARKPASPKVIMLRPESMLGKTVQLGRWLVTHLYEEGVFDGVRALDASEREQVRRLNRALLMGIFGLKDTYWESATYPILERNFVVSTMQRAGYRLVTIPPPHTYNNYFIFEPEPLCRDEPRYPACE